jgi:hypothetical protein
VIHGLSWDTVPKNPALAPGPFIFVAGVVMTGSSDTPRFAKRLCTAVLILGLAPLSVHAGELASFCERLPRPAYAALEKHSSSNSWFEVYNVEPGVFAIYEPFQWQEVISYLITGADRALLFDTGNGMGDIKAIVEQLTDKPITVLNSHTHFDHIGGNYQFDDILSVSTDFSIENSHASPMKR